MLTLLRINILDFDAIQKDNSSVCSVKLNRVFNLRARHAFVMGAACHVLFGLVVVF